MEQQPPQDQTVRARPAAEILQRAKQRAQQFAAENGVALSEPAASLLALMDTYTSDARHHDGVCPETPTTLARALGVRPRVIYPWLEELREGRLIAEIPMGATRLWLLRIRPYWDAVIGSEKEPKW